MSELRLAAWLASSAFGCSNESGQAAVVALFLLNISTMASLKEVLLPVKMLSSFASSK
jgi:hypothetical protein